LATVSIFLSSQARKRLALRRAYSDKFNRTHGVADQEINCSEDLSCNFTIVVKRQFKRLYSNFVAQLLEQSHYVHHQEDAVDPGFRRFL